MSHALEEPIELLTGREALARVTELVVGGSWTDEPAFAEGLALAGMRAASALDDDPSRCSFATRLPPGASCVHHLSGPAASDTDPALILTPGTVQEAIDCGLAAHLASQALGRPIACRAGVDLARRLEPVRLPTREEVRAALEPWPPRSGDPRDIARLALERVSGVTGRPLSPERNLGEGRAEDAPAASRLTPTLRISVVPAGEWAERIARAIALPIARSGRWEIHQTRRGDLDALVLGLRESNGQGDPRSEPARDLLVAGDITLLEPELLATVAAGGRVLVRAAALTPAILLRGLSQPQLGLLRERGLMLSWIDATGVASTRSEPAEEPDEIPVIAGAALRALEHEGPDLAEDRLRDGATHARDVEADVLSAALDSPGDEVDFRPESNLPRLPSPFDDPEVRETWRRRARRFHFGAPGARRGPGLPLMPLALRDLGASLATARAWPLTLSDGSEVALAPGCGLELYLRVMRQTRAPARKALSEERARLSRSLRELLLSDELKRPEGRSEEALREGLGTSASFFDPASLARTLPKAAGSEALDDARRARIAAALEALEAGPGELEDGVLVAGHDIATVSDEPRIIRHRDPLGAAVGVFDGLAHRTTELVRALRLARLELEDRVRAERLRALEDLDWQGFTAGELALVPPVVVVVTAAAARREGLGQLSRLLRASRPVRVLVIEGGFDEADAACFHLDLGTLAIAHREAFVIQTSLARPEPLVASFARMTASPRPGVAIIREPVPEPAAWRELRALAALHARVTPELVYDPDGGASWADRLDLTGNPQPEHPWPRRSVAVTGVDGGRLEPAMTFADAVLVEPALRVHAVPIPAAARDDQHQMPLAEYLEALERGDAFDRIPYVWTLDPGGDCQRAVLTRELTILCLGRLRAWHALQELGGFDNAFAARAARAAREAAEAEAKAQLDAARATREDDLERARSEAAYQSMERLAAVLMSMDPGQLDGLGLGMPTPTAMTPPPAPDRVTAKTDHAADGADDRGEKEEEEDDEEEPIGDEPYIDTPLCTTCNECTNLNPLLFVYNADQQAEIGDPDKGTFSELVRAAELCPAKCIHPGKPRSGDDTATPEVVARAAAFA